MLKEKKNSLCCLEGNLLLAVNKGIDNDRKDRKEKLKGDASCGG